MSAPEKPRLVLDTTRSAGRCPNCGRPRVREYRPFCSGRCRDVDLGRWLSGAYKIPVIDEPDPDEDA